MIDAASGTFQVGYLGLLTPSLAYNCSAAALQSALQGLSTVGAGGFTVTGSDGGPWTITAGGALANQDIAMLTVLATGLGGIPTGSVVETTPGVEGTNTTQLVSIYDARDTLVDATHGLDETFTVGTTGTPSSGTFRFLYSGTYSPAIAWNADNYTISYALSRMFQEQAPLYIPDACVIWNPTLSVFQMYGDLGGRNFNLSLVTVDNASLVGGSRTIVGVKHGSSSAGFTPPTTQNVRFYIATNMPGGGVSINSDWNAAQVQTALETKYGVGNVSVSDYTKNYVSACRWGLWRVDFIGALAGSAVALMTTSIMSNPTGRSIEIVQYTPPSAGTNEVQTLSSTATEGTFQLRYKGEFTTDPIDWDATGAEIQVILRETHPDLALVVCSAGQLPGDDITITFSGAPLRYTDVQLLEFLGENLGYNVVETTKGSVAPVLSITTIQNGGDPIYSGLTGGTFSVKFEPTGMPAFIVADIPYDVTAAELDTLIEAVIGAGNCVCTDGPLPGSPIDVEFTGDYAQTSIPAGTIYPSLQGDFDGSVSTQIIRSHKVPTRTDNTWEIVIIPGEGTPGVKVDDTTPANTTFAIQVRTNTGIVAPSDKSIQIRFVNCTPERIEDAINEAFGKEVVKVTRVCHSYEYSEIVSSPYSGETLVYFGWYYRDVFRLVWVNDYANPDTIESMNILLPAGLNVSSFMEVTEFESEEEDASPFGEDGEPTADDLAYESSRTAYLFYVAELESQPLHEFSILRIGETAPTSLCWKYKLLTSYIVDKTTTINLAHIGIADLLADARIRFKWCTFTYTGIGESNTEEKEYADVCVSDWMNWDSTAEQIRYSIERMIQLKETYVPKFFGVGNVTVTGSLYNSWLTDPFVSFLEDGSDQEGDWVDVYHDLSITLVGLWDKLPLHDYHYELVMELDTDPVGWIGEDNRLKAPAVYQHTYSKPLPPLRNERQRITVTNATDEMDIGYLGETAAINNDSTATEVQTAINSVMGQLPINEDLVDIEDDPIAVDLYFLPEKYRRAVTVYGTNIATDPMEFELAGYGYQFQDNNLVTVIADPDGLMTLIVVQQGLPLQSEVFVFTLTGAGVFGGTFTITYAGQTTAAINWNDSAATIVTRLKALSNIEDADITAGTGGPINTTAVQVTFASSLGAIATPTTTSSLKNASGTIAETQQGGLDGTLTIYEITRGSGSGFYDSEANWSLFTLPSSQDTLVIDDTPAQMIYGLSQKDTFKVAGTDGKMLLLSRRRRFVNGQKVWIYNTGGALPTNLSTGYYYIRNTAKDATFYLSATSNGSIIANDAGIGTGTHHVVIKEIDLQVYARYPGKTIGLERYRQGDVQEYLSTYLTMGFTNIELGIDQGNGLSLGRFDTLNFPVDVIVRTSGQSSQQDIPAVQFLFDHADSTLEQFEGDVGIAVYADQTSQLDTITQHNGQMLVCNTTVGTTITSIGIFTVRRSTAGSTINIQS